MARRARFTMARVLVALAATGGAALLPAVASGAATSKAPIVIGYIGDFTGVSSSTFADGLGGAQARIALQNAHGGIDGRKLKLVSADTQSTPAATATAVQKLISVNHVFGIIEDSAFFFAGDRYAQQAGVPVTGYGIDGPEWFDKSFPNMFDVVPSLSIGPVNGVTYTSTTRVKFLKSKGVTKFGILGYGISPSSTRGVKAEVYAAKTLGMDVCYENVSVPFGGVDFTADVLQMKTAGCNGYDTSFEDASDIAIAQAVKNAGIPMKAQLMTEGYDNDVLDNPAARAAIDGDYFASIIDFTSPNAPTRQMRAALHTYDHGFTGIPDLGLYSGYLSADLMIYGLQHAGKNPTPASFISNLRKVGSYNAGGILATPTNFRGLGTKAMLPKSDCEYFVQLQGSRFVTVNGGKTICGKVIEVPASAEA
ncbi:MAG TPA: ABC transporter substrate-binding protein [Acidimicrobiales bacterium]|nr:ABC transporter substrate-binding protein [Acidimicrobiales bacterium]